MGVVVTEEHLTGDVVSKVLLLEPISKPLSQFPSLAITKEEIVWVDFKNGLYGVGNPSVAMLSGSS